MTYATVLVDLERRRPVDVLPGRDAEPLATWLLDHPEVEIICRDRAGAYAEGARTGAPQAVQVADAWHLWKNVGEAVEKTVAAHYTCVRAVFEKLPVPEPTTAPTGDDGPLAASIGTLDVCGRERRLVVRTRERFALVQDLLHDGASLESICHRLQLDRSTVRRFARATSIDELLVKTINRSTILDAHRPHLHQRWNQGCHNTAQLHREITALGFTGGIQTVRRYLRNFAPSAPTPAPRPAPRPRRVVRWIMTNPGNLPDADALSLKEIRVGCPERDAVTDHVRDFAEMMRDLRGDQLPQWMERVEQDPLPALHSLVNGLRRRTVQPMELRPGRGTEHESEASQAGRIRPRQLRPPTQADPAQNLTPDHKISDVFHGAVVASGGSGSPGAGLDVQPDPQRADRLEAMTDGDRQVIGVLVADHRQGGEQPVHRVKYDGPGRVRAAVQSEDIGDSDHLVAATRHRSGNHPAVRGLSGEHEGGRVVQQFGPEEVRVASPVVPGERPGAQRVRIACHVPGKV